MSSGSGQELINCCQATEVQFSRYSSDRMAPTICVGIRISKDKRLQDSISYVFQLPVYLRLYYLSNLG